MESVLKVVSSPPDLLSANPALLKYFGGNAERGLFSLETQKRAGLCAQPSFLVTISSPDLQFHKLITK